MVAKCAPKIRDIHYLLRFYYLLPAVDYVLTRAMLLQTQGNLKLEDLVIQSQDSR